MTPASRSAQRAVHTALVRWYAAHGRDLPWRHTDATPWGVYVSEIMAQQTPVARVVEPWREWLRRWPTPAALAAESPAEVIRAWGRLGYPRRAVNLRAAARIMVADHDGRVPRDPEQLRALPGVGDYTAAAVASFAFGVPMPVVDTNVRRVLARVAGGTGQARPSLTGEERRRAADWLPTHPARANTWNVACMEFGALVCTARSPGCDRCPITAHCRWFRAGRPDYDGPRRAPQGYAGTDRQLRGTILARLRAGPLPVPDTELVPLAEAARLAAVLDALERDGLLTRSQGGYDLPR